MARPHAKLRGALLAQDIDGEYGHTQHLIVSQACIDAVDLAADPDKYPDSASCGPWLIKKLYLHLWPEDQLRMDWHQPLTAFGGKTGLQIAEEAFACHVTQQERWKVEDGGEWDNALFGLWRTTVGADVMKNDLFENIPEN